MDYYALDEFRDHEQVSVFYDKPSGLKAIVAVHRATPQFAVGGTRMRPYDDFDSAMRDALRLSRAMTYKLALADIPLGGGKAVIIGDPQTDKNDVLLHAFGDAVDALGGRYYCAPDIGTNPDDMIIVNDRTPFVRGLIDQAGDSSYVTALGVFHAMRACALQQLERSDLEDVSVAVQGVGKVGSRLCRMLHDAGAKLFVADANAAAAAEIASETGAIVLAPDEVLFAEADIVAPCALGGVISEASIARMRATIVCGGANNQLATEKAGAVLAARGMLYAPDYVANAGGVIGGCKMDCGWSDDDVDKKIAGIFETCLGIFDAASKTGHPSNVIADEFAEEKIGAQSRRRS